MTLGEFLPFLRYPLLIIAVIYFLMWGIEGVLDMPEVHFSNSTGECVRVLTKDGPGDCNNLPKKYHHVWVE